MKPANVKEASYIKTGKTTLQCYRLKVRIGRKLSLSKYLNIASVLNKYGVVLKKKFIILYSVCRQKKIGKG